VRICITSYAVDWLSTSFWRCQWVAGAYNCAETLCEGWRHKVVQVSSWTRKPGVVDTGS